MGSGHRAAWAEGPKQGLGDTVVTVLEECVCVSTAPIKAAGGTPKGSCAPLPG